MKRLPARSMALLLTIAAVAAAGCGSSSSSKNKPASNPPATSASQPGTPSTPSTPASGGITASTPISSPAYRALLIKGEQQATQGKFTQTQLGQLADCAIKKLQGQGIKTVGEALQHQSEFRNLGSQCATELGIHPK